MRMNNDMRRTKKNVLLFTIIGVLGVLLLGILFAIFGGMSNSSEAISPAEFKAAYINAEAFLASGKISAFF